MALPTLDATFASAADLPRRYMLAQWLVNIQYSGSVADYITLPEYYLWAKIAVAAGAPRGEADYISLPKNYIWKDIYDAVSGSSAGTIDWGEKQAIGHIAAAYRGDTANPANIATYIDWPWRYQIASIVTHTNIDTDAQAFITTSGATDKENIDQFVKGVKNLGLWSSMVCWPLRSTQNAGFGDTVYSLGGLGTYDGTRVNAPAWGTDGVTFSAASSQAKTDALGLPSYPMSSVIIGQRVSGTGSAAWQYLGTTTGATRSVAKRMYANNSAGSSIVGVGYIVLVNTNAQALSDNFEAFAAIIPSATNAQAEVFINTTKPAQTAQAATWGTNASTAGTFGMTGDGVFRMSFHATFTTAINNTAFYNLYRATLGQGLGLP